MPTTRARLPKPMTRAEGAICEIAAALFSVQDLNSLAASKPNCASMLRQWRAIHAAQAQLREQETRPDRTPMEARA